MSSSSPRGCLTSQHQDRSSNTTAWVGCWQSNWPRQLHPQRTLASAVTADVRTSLGGGAVPDSRTGSRAIAGGVPNGSRLAIRPDASETTRRGGPPESPVTPLIIPLTAMGLAETKRNELAEHREAGEGRRDAMGRRETQD